MTWVVMTFMLLCAAVLQSILPPFVLLANTKLPLLLAVVLYYALNRDLHMAVVAGFFAGCFQDILGDAPLGYSALCFCVISLATGCFRRAVMSESVIAQSVFGAVSGAVATLCLYFMLSGTEGLICRTSWVVMKTFWAGILSAICVPAIFFVIVRLDQKVGNVEAPEGEMDEIW